MSFHLEGPWLSTTGRKRGPKKWASAEAKKQAEQRKTEWATLKQELGVKEDIERRKRAQMTGTLTVKITTPPGRETAHIPSQDTGWVTCAKLVDKEYTGEKMIGIGQMHKSNACPIFTDQEAKDISSMRR